MKYMNDPLDLDPFSEDHIEITRVLDLDQAAGRRKLITYAVKVMTCSDEVLLGSGLQLKDWQRACFEANDDLRSDGSESHKVMARSLWILVQYIQEVMKLSTESRANKELAEEFAERGISPPWG